MPEGTSSLAVQLGGLSISLSVYEGASGPAVSVLVDQPVPVTVCTGPASAGSASAAVGAAAPSALAAGGVEADPGAGRTWAGEPLPTEVAVLESRLQELGGF